MHQTTWRLTVNRVFAASGVTLGVGIAGHVESLSLSRNAAVVDRWNVVAVVGLGMHFPTADSCEQNTRGRLKAQSTIGLSR
jgi:hypothetical protein